MHRRDENSWIKCPGAEQVRVLWGMEREKRLQMWRTLSPFQEVEELELGGVTFRECPMGLGELLMLLPEGGGALAGVRKLTLCRCGVEMEDGVLRTLFSSGCGRNMSSLRLVGE